VIELEENEKSLASTFEISVGRLMSFTKNSENIEASAHFEAILEGLGVELAPLERNFLSTYTRYFPSALELGGVEFIGDATCVSASDGVLQLSTCGEVSWDFQENRIFVKQQGYVFSYHPSLFFEMLFLKNCPKATFHFKSMNLDATKPADLTDWVGPRGWHPSALSCLEQLVRALDFPSYFHFFMKWGFTEFTRDLARGVGRARTYPKPFDSVVYSEFQSNCSELDLDSEPLKYLFFR